MDVEVFREGYLSGPLAAVDATVAVGEAMGYLVADAAEVQAGEGAPAQCAAAAAPEGAARERNRCGCRDDRARPRAPRTSSLCRSCPTP